MILAHLIAGPTAILAKPLGPEFPEPPADGLRSWLGTEASPEILHEVSRAHGERYRGAQAFEEQRSDAPNDVRVTRHGGHLTGAGDGDGAGGRQRSVVAGLTPAQIFDEPLEVVRHGTLPRRDARGRWRKDLHGSEIHVGMLVKVHGRGIEASSRAKGGRVMNVGLSGSGTEKYLRHHSHRNIPGTYEAT